MSTISMPLPLIDIPGEHTRGLGVLAVEKTAGRVSLPLAEVKISARVADRVASVTLLETFRNPYQEHLEAVYIFPLPGGAAVSDFEMKVGQRIIRGKVEERAEARRQYQEAIDAGKRAALLEKERDDVFTVQVGNLPPGEEIGIRITYSERLPFFEDGNTELRLPLVVAPRYIPGTPVNRDPVGEGVEEDTDIVPDASRITPPRLAKGFDPKVSLGIDVELMLTNAGGEQVELVDLSCSQHATRTSAGSGSVKVKLARNDEALNRDFVLRWQLTGEKLRTNLMVYRDAERGEKHSVFGMLSLIPPKQDKVATPPRDVVFVLDRSGSMQGVKMTSAARACSILLNTLGPNDRFAISAFDNSTEWLEPANKAHQRDYFLFADEANKEKGDKFLRGIDARGGTEMYVAVTDAIDTITARSQGNTPSNSRVPVIVLLTDGEVGDESRIFKHVQQQSGNTRIFTVGIDTAVNQGFLQRLAGLGGGTATFVEPGLQLEEALSAVGREIGAPLIVDVKLEDIDSGLELTAIAPTRVPDLFAGRATTAFFTAEKIGRVRVKGRYTTGGEFSAVVTAQEIALPAVAQLWAKTRIADLEDKYRIEVHLQHDLKQQIIKLSTGFSILTRFTAFVVVDHSEIVNKDGTQRKVVQPVETPDRWDMNMDPFAGGGNLNISAKSAMPMMPSAPAPMSIAPGCAPPPPPPAEQRARGITIGSAKADSADDQMKTYSMNAPARPSAPSSTLGGLRSNDKAKKSAPKREESAQKAPRPAESRPAPMANQAESVTEEEGGFLSKAIDAVTGLFKRDSNKPATGKLVTPVDPVLQPLRVILMDAVLLFQQAWTDIKKGVKPDISSLEDTRIHALAALQNPTLAAEMPKLLSFFEQQASKLLGTLKQPGITMYQLQTEANQIFSSFTEACQEAQGPLNLPKTQNNFWDSSI